MASFGRPRALPGAHLTNCWQAEKGKVMEHDIAFHEAIAGASRNLSGGDA